MKKYLPPLLFFILIAPLFIISLKTQPQPSSLDLSSKELIEERAKEGKKMHQRSLRIAHLYNLPNNSQFKDITSDILQSQETGKKTRAQIEKQKRRFILFRYPSDGLQVKAVISYTPEIETAPLLIFLRGGNRTFGLMPPANPFSLFGSYTVISPTYRGGVSEGTDEFGGEDVNDVKNLVDYIPTLEKLLDITIQPKKKYILGGSRGGMQMFLALQRYPYLQEWFDKGVSLSGGLNMRSNLEDRKDMLSMFIRDFGLKNENDNAWITHRNPIEHYQKIKPNFPLLIIQGTKDTRINLSEGREMVKLLKEAKRNITYWEVEGGTHCLRNKRAEYDTKIMAWLES